VILFIIHVKINIFFGQGDASIIDLVLHVCYKKMLNKAFWKENTEENVTFWNKSGVRLDYRHLPPSYPYNSQGNWG
jgi:hypothetical protein